MQLDTLVLVARHGFRLFRRWNLGIADARGNHRKSINTDRRMT
jgi:hypothetical protein